MRRFLLPAVLLATAVVLCAAPAAGAYVLFPGVPKLRTYTYSSTAKAYKAEVRAAARAWNHSGVRVRWAQSRHPRVRIRVSSQIPSAGLATFTYGGRSGFRGLIQLQPGLMKNQASAVHGRALATAIIVHEMGHIMGLNHEDRRCAVMNSLLWQMCKHETEAWLYHCRPFERDDVRGLLHRFGGHARHLGPLFCNAEAQPGLPSGVAVTSGPTGVQVSYKVPPGAARVRVLRRRDTCPKAVQDPGTEFVSEDDVKPGETKTVADQGIYQTGHYCYAVVGLGKLGRPGKPATAQFDFTGGVGGPTGPVASFSVTADESDPSHFGFASDSYDADGSIVSWQWDFGDGGTGSGEAVDHHYITDGEHTVTLTVTDNDGNTATYTDSVFSSSGASG
jgi:chitodextrinase